jgi:DNA-binding CsgD family transcriptional regulator
MTLLAERPTAEILEHLSTLARGATGHAASAAALELAAEVAPAGRRRLLTLAAADAQLAGESQRATDLLRRAAATGEATPASQVGAAEAVASARREMAHGRYRAAEQELAAIAAHLWASGAIHRLPPVLALRSWALARVGDLTAAAGDADQALALARLTENDQVAIRAHHTRALLAVLRGAAPGATERTDPVRAGLILLAALATRRPGRLGANAEIAAEFLPDLLECRLLRDRVLCPADLDTLHGLTRSATAPIAANAWRVLGLTSRDGANDCFRRAAGLHTGMDLPFDNARVHLSYGERLRRDGDRRAARNQLRTARDGFARLNAVPWEQRAERELTGTDETRAGRAPTGLTPAEYEVARVVATGVSTREAAERLFLSPKTVEFHLSKVFRKLGVSSRAQLAHVFPELAWQ